MANQNFGLEGWRGWEINTRRDIHFWAWEGTDPEASGNASSHTGNVIWIPSHTSLLSVQWDYRWQQWLVWVGGLWKSPTFTCIATWGGGGSHLDRVHKLRVQQQSCRWRLACKLLRLEKMQDLSVLMVAPQRFSCTFTHEASITVTWDSNGSPSLRNHGLLPICWPIWRPPGLPRGRLVFGVARRREEWVTSVSQ